MSHDPTPDPAQERIAAAVRAVRESFRGPIADVERATEDLLVELDARHPAAARLQRAVMRLRRAAGEGE